MASLNGTDKRVADDAETFAHDVQRGAARVLNAAGNGAKKLSRQVKPSARGTLKDQENAVAQWVRTYPWTALSAVAAAGVVLGYALVRRR